MHQLYKTSFNLFAEILIPIRLNRYSPILLTNRAVIYNQASKSLWLIVRAIVKAIVKAIVELNIR